VSAFISYFHPSILPDAAKPKQLLLCIEEIRYATGARLYERSLGKSGVQQKHLYSAAPYEGGGELSCIRN
jgi:hypothetical protein